MLDGAIHSLDQLCRELVNMASSVPYIDLCLQEVRPQIDMPNLFIGYNQVYNDTMCMCMCVCVYQL